MNDPKYKQLREQFFSIMCEVTAEFTQAEDDYKAGKIDVYEFGPRQQKALLKGRDKAMQAFDTFHKEDVERAVREARIDELHKVLDTRSETRSEILALPLKRRLRQLQTIRIAAELEKKL